MSIQAALEKIDTQIQEARDACKAELDKLTAAQDAAIQKRDKKITDLQAKASALALEEKLKEYPAALVNGHKTCSVCGGQMRPFKLAQGEIVSKFWACQNGSLQNNHDLVIVE